MRDDVSGGGLFICLFIFKAIHVLDLFFQQNKNTLTEADSDPDVLLHSARFSWFMLTQTVKMKAVSSLMKM